MAVKAWVPHNPALLHKNRIHQQRVTCLSVLGAVGANSQLAAVDDLYDAVTLYQSQYPRTMPWSLILRPKLLWLSAKFDSIYHPPQYSTPLRKRSLNWKRTIPVSQLLGTSSSRTSPPPLRIHRDLMMMRDRHSPLALTELRFKLLAMMKQVVIQEDRSRGWRTMIIILISPSARRRLVGEIVENEQNWGNLSFMMKGSSSSTCWFRRIWRFGGVFGSLTFNSSIWKGTRETGNTNIICMKGRSLMGI